MAERALTKSFRYRRYPTIFLRGLGSSELVRRLRIAFTSSIEPTKPCADCGRKSAKEWYILRKQNNDLSHRYVERRAGVFLFVDNHPDLVYRIYRGSTRLKEANATRIEGSRSTHNRICGSPRFGCISRNIHLGVNEAST